MNWYQSIIQAALASRLQIFFGAGTSFGAGLPLAFGKDGIVPEFLKALRLEDADGASSIGPGLPFEAYFEAAARLTQDTNYSGNLNGIKELLEPFNVEKPGGQHQFLAALVSEGMVSSTITTNFDRLLEIAFEDSTGRQLPINIDSDSPQASPCLTKLHGCISKPEELGLTLSNIGAKQSISWMADYLPKAFSNPSTTLIIGYSLSDVFDITPILEGIDSKQEVILLVHSNDGKVEFGDDLSKQTLGNLLGTSETTSQKPNPFKRFPNATWVKADTDEILQMLSNELLNKQFDFTRHNEVEWRHKYESWGQKLSPAVKKLILCELYNQSGQYKMVRTIGESMTQSFLKPNDMINGLMVRAIAEHRLGMHEDALKLYKKCEPFLTENETIASWGLYNNIQKLANEMQNADLAFEYQGKADQFAKSLPNEGVLQQAHARTCLHTNMNFNPGADESRFDEAHTNFAGGFGEVKGRAYSLLAHMRRASSTGDMEGAKSFGEQALVIGQKCNDPFIISTAANNIGAIIKTQSAVLPKKDSKDIEYAVDCIRLAIDTSYASGNDDGYFKAKLNMLDFMMVLERGPETIRQESEALSAEAKNRGFPQFAARAILFLGEYLMLTEADETIDEGISLKLEAAEQFMQCYAYTGAAEALLSIGGIAVMHGKVSEERALRVFNHRREMKGQRELEQALIECKVRMKKLSLEKMKNVDVLREKMGLSPISDRELKDAIVQAEQMNLAADWVSFDAYAERTAILVKSSMQENQKAEVLVTGSKAEILKYLEDRYY